MIEPQVLIDRKVLYSNVRCLLKQEPGSVLFPVLKANAYGHGYKLVSSLLESEFSINEIPYFCVARYTEARELRAAGIERPLLVLSHFSDNDLLGSKKVKNVDLVLSSWADIELLENLSVSGFNVHINLNSGMNRIGLKLPFTPVDRKKLLGQIEKLFQKGISVTGLMSHLACGEKDPQEFSNLQIELFAHELFELKKDWIDKKHGEWPRWRHVENSGALSWGLGKRKNNLGLDLTAARPGLHLWGVAASVGLEISKQLKPVMKVVAPLRQILHVKKGESIGYSRSYVATDDMLVGVVSLGYADGVPRSLSTTNGDASNIGFVVEGERVPIVGKVSMDMTTVDLSRHSKYQYYFSLQSGTEKNAYSSLEKVHAYWICDEQTVLEVANELKTISYEVLCAINFRILRKAI